MFNTIYCYLVEYKVPDDIIFLIFEYLICASMNCNEYGNKKLRERVGTADYFYCSFHYEEILEEIEDEYYNEYEDYGSDGIYERY